MGARRGRPGLLVGLVWWAVVAGMGAAGGAAPGSQPAAGGEGFAGGQTLREVFSDTLLGDGSVVALPMGDWLLLVALEPRMVPGRVAGDAVDFEMVRRYPAVAAYYLWRAAGAAAEHRVAWRRLVVAFPGQPGVGAEADAQAALLAPGDVFEPALAGDAIRVYVDGALMNPDPASWALAADGLAVRGDAWLERYRPRGSLGSAPDISSLVRARRLYEAALDLYPTHSQAASRIAVVDEKLEAASLFGRAAALLEQHERALREADRRHDELGAQRHSFYLWRAAELLQESLRRDKALLGAAAALDRVMRLLGDRPRPPFETAAQLEAELKEAYQRQARELDYPQARSAGEALRGLRVHLAGTVVQRAEYGPQGTTGTANRPPGLLVAVQGPGAAGQESPSGGVAGEDPWLVYVQLPEGVLPEPVQEVPVGQQVEVWGELAGNYRFREPSGRSRVVLRVVAAYVQLTGSG